MAESFFPPDHPFIVAVRERDLPRIKELVAQSNMLTSKTQVPANERLINAQVRGDITLTGKVWKDGEHVDVGENDPHHAGALHFAAFHGHAELARVLIEMGADICLPADFGEHGGRKSSAIGLAAWEGDAATLKVLLDAARAAKIDADLTPSLQSALAHSAWEKADLLVEYGAEHDFYTAAMAGAAEILTQLIETAADSIDAKHSGFDGTPLEEALKVGQFRTAEMLAEHGAKVTTEAAAAMGRIEQVKSLLDNDPEAAGRFFGTQPLLCWATQGGQPEVVKLLLQRGADPNGGDKWDVTPLRHVAQVQGEVGGKIVDLLVAAGADVDRKSRGYTPIQCALNSKNKHVHHRLVFHIENDVEVSDSAANFWRAVRDGDLATVESSLARDASLASKRFPTHGAIFFCTDGLPLHVASAKGHWGIVKLLLKHGADPDAKRDLAEAERRGIDAQHRELGMPLMHAYGQGNYEMVHLLLDKGATVHGHPYCMPPFASVVYSDATAAGAPTSMVLRGIPDLDADDRKKIAPVPDEAPEVIRLYDRILSLGAIPDHGAIAQAGDFETVEMLLRKHPAGVSKDHWGGNVHEALLYGSAWHGNCRVVEMCMDICTDRHTTYAAQHCIRQAITSHNRPGTFDEYYRIIELNLDYLKSHNAFDEHAMFTPLQCLADGFRCGDLHSPCPEPPTVEHQLKLAQLCLDKGVDVNHVTPTYCKFTALDLALYHDQNEYADFLRGNSGKTTHEGESLMKEKGG